MSRVSRLAEGARRAATGPAFPAGSRARPRMSEVAFLLTGTGRAGQRRRIAISVVRTFQGSPA